MATIKCNIKLDALYPFHMLNKANSHKKSTKVYNIDEKLFNDYNKVMEELERIQDTLLYIELDGKGILS